MAKRYAESMAMTSTTDRYKRSVQAVTESPMAKAADAVDSGYYLSQVEKSQKRMSQRLRDTPLSRYKDNAVEKAGRLASGAKLSQSKVDKHFADWANTYAEASQAAASLPPSTDESSMLARVAASVRVLKAKAGKL
jgi:hypothetical protein